MSKRLQGQVIVFENVIIFSMSVMLFIFSFMIFLNFQDYYKNVAIHDQLNKIENMVITGIITVATDEDTNSSVVIKIPTTITNEHYDIGFYDGRLKVTLRDVEKVSNVFGLGNPALGTEKPFDFSGRIASSKGKITIYKNGNQINIL
jgi:hypothetical protein